MEVLFSFESSRRVIVVENREALMGAIIEEHIRHRFPERDIAIAPLGREMPGSTKTKHILQKHTEKWGLVDVAGVAEINSGDVLTLTKLDKVRLHYRICLELKIRNYSAVIYQLTWSSSSYSMIASFPLEIM